MNSLEATEFSSFFEAVHGYQPHSWQTRLAEQVLSEGAWPRAVDMPTGTGKTSLLDIAVFSLAARPDIFPRRIFFVIDRRIVVDQVSKQAQCIANKILRSLNPPQGGQGSSSALLKVSQNLREVSGGDLLKDEAPLGVAALRGGIPLERKWTQRPDQPWVVTTTVDQFGSRLLFRGYGTSYGARPIHAGLCGNDCLIILDEIHLARAFSQTLRDATSCGEYDGIVSINEHANLPRRMQIVEMSATSRSEGSEDDTFTYSEDELSENSLFSKVVKAPKSIIAVPTSGGKEIHKWFPKAAAGLLKKIEPHEHSVGIIVNRVKTAREINTKLKEEGYDSLLVTGRMRPIDKLAFLKELEERTDPDRERIELTGKEKPLVTVATQTIEVGADFSFDALITEIAPIDSLVQRLGRLNRRGSLALPDKPSRCWVVGSDAALKTEDFVYGPAPKETWDTLNFLSDSNDADIPAGSNELDLDDFPAEAYAPYRPAPILLPTHIEAWVQTNPQPSVEPQLDPFLHGLPEPDHEDPQQEVSLIWRHDISPAGLEAVRPRTSEMLSVPLHSVKAWLNAQEEAVVYDIDGFVPQNSKPKFLAHGREATEENSADVASKQVTIWRPDGENRVSKVVISKIRPGDVIVLSPDRGGLTDGNWNPSIEETENSIPEAITDLGDAAQWFSQHQCTLRLDERLFEHLELPSIPTPSEEREAEVPAKDRITEWLISAKELLESIEIKEEFNWLREVIDHLTSSNWAFHRISPPEYAGYYLLRSGIDPDEGRWSETGAGTPLKDHLKGVGKVAAEFAQRVGLPEKLVDDFRLAGELHDIGKVDPKFQLQMVGQDKITLAGLGQPLAKSLPGVHARPGAWPTVRHEFSSLALACSNDDVISLANDKDLVLHLISTHHGQGRPVPLIRYDDKPAELEFLHSHNGKDIPMHSSMNLSASQFSIEVTERFWRLNEKYGHHGLAWLEAVFRLADQRRSMLETREEA